MTAEAPTTVRTSYGVALSGGGVRAAFFALGSLLYLVHSGLHRDVRLISSVSGGSIVNGVVASAGDFSSADPSKFGKLAALAGSRMAKNGVFFWPGLGLLAGAIGGASLGVLLGALLSLALGIPGSDTDWSPFWFLLLWYPAAVAAFFLFYVWLGRSRIQQKSYRSFLDHVFERKGRARSKHDMRLEKLPESAVAHVLCATELTSGQPFYMSRAMVLSPLYGRGKANIPLHKAIYASAAFPIGFPPLRLAADELELTGGLDDRPPGKLLLSDGGVFNNLGTDAFSANDSAAQIFLPDPSLQIIPAVDRQVVVNASAPPKKAKLSGLPLWRTVVSTKRIMSVMYENTVRPRQQQLMADQANPAGPIVVDISESPIELIERLSKGRAADDEVLIRAQHMLDALRKARKVQDWKDYAERAATTKTVLNAVGSTSAVRLLHLGYLDTAIACHAHLGAPGFSVEHGFSTVPDDRWFGDLVGNRLTDEQLMAPVAEPVGTD